MSEQMADQTSGESGSLKAALGSLETPSTPFAVSAKESVPETTNVDSPKLSPEQGGPGETLKVDTAKADAPKAEARYRIAGIHFVHPPAAFDQGSAMGDVTQHPTLYRRHSRHLGFGRGGRRCRRR